MIFRLRKYRCYLLSQRGRNVCDMLDELRAAKHFIFVEYFIVSEGEMWEEVLKILKQKADEGLDVPDDI